MKMKFETANDVRLRIDELRETKRKDLIDIEARRAEAQRDLEFAQAAIDAAAASLDQASYEDALSKKRKAESSLELCALRSRQLQNAMVSEAESDEAIAALLACEDALAEEFKKDLSKHLSALEKLLTGYRADVQDIEDVLLTWTTEVHQNYRAPHTMKTRPDGTTTNRMDTPQPIHSKPYTGCAEADRLQDYLGRS